MYEYIRINKIIFKNIYLCAKRGRWNQLVRLIFRHKRLWMQVTMGVYGLILLQLVVLTDICRINIAKQIIGLQFIL